MEVQRLNLLLMVNAKLSLARAVYLIFTTQKNDVENEAIKMELSGDHCVSAVNVVIRRVVDFRSHNALPTTPSARVYTGVGQ